MSKDVRKKIGENEYVLAWVPAEDTTLGDAHYIDTTDYQIPTPKEIREVIREKRTVFKIGVFDQEGNFLNHLCTEHRYIGNIWLEPLEFKTQQDVENYIKEHYVQGKYLWKVIEETAL